MGEIPLSSIPPIVIGGSAALGVFVVGCALIGESLGAQDRLDDAAFAGRAGTTAPSVLRGTGARTRFRRAILVSLVAPFAPLGLASAASTVGRDAAALTILAAELGCLAAFAAMFLSYRAFARRVDAEAAAGYSSFDATPFGDPIRGLWTRLGTADPSPPRPIGSGVRPPLDPLILDALDSRLELSPPIPGIEVPATPPALLPGVPAAAWYRWGQRLVLVALVAWIVVFLPAVFWPAGDLRTALMLGAVALFLVPGPAGAILGFVGRRRAFAERAAGYTTLRARDESYVNFGHGPTVDAWESFGTDRLWHLDPANGSVIRAPIDPAAVLRDPRIRPPLRRLFGSRSRP